MAANILPSDKNKPHKELIPARVKRSLQSLQTYILLTLFLLVAVVPFLIIMVTAFKTNAEIAQGVFVLPGAWKLDNIIKAWRVAHFATYFKSSILVAASVVAGSTVLAVLSGYGFGRFRFPLHKLLFFVFLLGLMVPQESYIIPLYYNLRKLGLTDTYWALILPQIGMSMCFGTFWMRGAFSEIPRDLVDAARVDGASNWKALWQVMFPLVAPAILTMMVLFFVWTWNDFLVTLVMVQKDALRTLPVGLAFFQGTHNIDIPLTSAGATIVSLPTIIFYIIFQRQFMRGITAGAVKG